MTASGQRKLAVWLTVHKRPKFLHSTKRTIMSPGASRTVLRWIHLVFSIPIIGYVYSPFEEIPNYATPTRYVFLPVLVVTGLWMWKGHVVRRLISKKTA
jgi:hypothetical protein